MTFHLTGSDQPHLKLINACVSHCNFIDNLENNSNPSNAISMDQIKEMQSRFSGIKQEFATSANPSEMGNSVANYFFECTRNKTETFFKTQGCLIEVNYNTGWGKRLVLLSSLDGWKSIQPLDIEGESRWFIHLPKPKNNDSLAFKVALQPSKALERPSDFDPHWRPEINHWQPGEDVIVLSDDEALKIDVAKGKFLDVNSWGPSSWHVLSSLQNEDNNQHAFTPADFAFLKLVNACAEQYERVKNLAENAANNPIPMDQLMEIQDKFSLIDEDFKLFPHSSSRMESAFADHFFKSLKNQMDKLYEKHTVLIQVNYPTAHGSHLGFFSSMDNWKNGYKLTQNQGQSFIHIPKPKDNPIQCKITLETPFNTKWQPGKNLCISSEDKEWVLNVKDPFSDESSWGINKSTFLISDALTPRRRALEINKLRDAPSNAELLPGDFACPFSYDFMVNPYRFPCGHPIDFESAVQLAARTDRPFCCLQCRKPADGLESLKFDEGFQIKIFNALQHSEKWKDEYREYWQK